MRQDFCIGFSNEHVSARDEFVSQLDIVLDDAIVYHDETTGAIGVRMRVRIVRRAVRRQRV